MSLATEAHERGIEIGFITSQKYAEEIGSAALDATVYVIPNRPTNMAPPPYEFPLYSHAFRHAQRLRGLGFDNVGWLKKTTSQEIHALQDFQPNAVVNDYRDTIRTAAQASGIPVVGITHTTGNEHGKTFGWWTQPPEDAKLPDCQDSFNEVRTSLGLDPIEDEREMFSGDINLIPSIPELDPLLVSSEQSHYVGMISNWQVTEKTPLAPIAQTMNQRVFSYVGEKTRPQYGYEPMLSEVIANMPNTGFYITGDPTRYDKRVIARRRAGEIIISDYIPGATAIEASEVVLCHGGNGTVMLSLTLGKPVICVGPYQSDCTSTFYGVEQSEAGIMLNHSKGPFERRSAPDLGSDIDIFGYWKTELNSEILQEAINATLTNSTYRENAQKLGNKLVALGGPQHAIDIIHEKLL
jgi:UDP:flavonoid glycosyltransferase YjiC (YdhE family)